jgi:spermidine synthase
VKKIQILNLITFLSAFLLFQIELIIAKIFLPHYGGSYLVWGSCIVFFQAVLLSGYLYTHWAIRALGIARYRYAHFVLLLLPLLFFPGQPLTVTYTGNALSLAADVFLRLMVTIGPVFFVLSTVSLFTQSYLAGSTLPARDNPYVLYSVSNLGSFAALLSYPFVFEYFLPLSGQLAIWRGLYFFIIVLHILALAAIKIRGEEAREEKRSLGREKLDVKRWFLWGAGGAMMFLSVNNIITVKIAPLPLLWILPLSIYLLAFVLNFKRSPWCPAWVNAKIHVILGLSVLLYFFIQQSVFPVMVELVLLNGILFILCVYCQNQLIRSKPRDDESLTAFYVVISLGSFVGGLMTSWVVPMVSTDLVEYMVGLILIGMTLKPSGIKVKDKTYYIRLVVIFMVLLMLWPVVFYEYNIFAVLLLAYIVGKVYAELAGDRHAVVISLVCLLFLTPLSETFWRGEKSIYKKRNYYGLYRIVDNQGIRLLYHGTTIHGGQSLRKGKEREPIIYYDRASPIARVMTSGLFDLKRIGVVGLGVGMVATYTAPGQKLDFYELDPDVDTMADQYFTYIKHAAGQINYVLGDARVSLEKNVSAKYDLLLVDAFGGDAIPVHLLTVEMVEKYKQHLNGGGILMFHISNRYLKLSPVLARIASVLDAHACQSFGMSSVVPGLVESEWVGITWDENTFKVLVDGLKWDPYDKNLSRRYRPWTDEYSTILPTIRMEELFNSVRNFKVFSW